MAVWLYCQRTGEAAKQLPKRGKCRVISYRNDITGIEAIDTRALTKILRDKGTMKGMITTDENFDKDDCIKRIKAWSMGHVVLDVTCKEKMSFPGDGYKVAVIDLGVKKNIVRCLLERGCSVTVYPAETPAEEIIADAPDGIMLTNGPGDPKDNVKTIEEIKKLFATKIPIFAICLGHQLLALANGADTQKMKYGHRGANHPVKDLKTGKVYISTQNHGYVVKEETLDRDIAEPSFINVMIRQLRVFITLERMYRRYSSIRKPVQARLIPDFCLMSL